MTKKIILFTILLLAKFSYGQDMHYSQGFNFPLLINPALGGAYNGVTRASLSFRNQNIAVPNTAFKGVYNTIGASVETKMFPKVGYDNTWTVGAMFLNDYAGSGTLATLQALAMTSYSVSLDRNGQSFLTVGTSIGINNRRLFSHDLIFESQVNGYEFDPNLPNLEPFLDGSSQTSFSANIGVLYQQQFGDMVLGQFGVGAFNINKPKELLISNSQENIYSRAVIHGGLLMMLDDYSGLFPSIIFMSQGPAKQVNLGMSYSNQINDDLGVIFGLRSRIGDAFIFLAGMDYRKFRTTISYDLTTSTLSQANKSSGAFEINLTYIMGQETTSYGRGKMHCPSF